MYLRFTIQMLCYSMVWTEEHQWTARPTLCIFRDNWLYLSIEYANVYCATKLINILKTKPHFFKLLLCEQNSDYYSTLEAQSSAYIDVSEINFSLLQLQMLSSIQRDSKPHGKDCLSSAKHMETLCHQTGKWRQLLMTLSWTKTW